MTFGFCAGVCQGFAVLEGIEGGEGKYGETDCSESKGIVEGRCVWWVDRRSVVALLALLRLRKEGRERCGDVGGFPEEIESW